MPQFLSRLTAHLAAVKRCKYFTKRYTVEHRKSGDGRINLLVPGTGSEMILFHIYLSFGLCKFASMVGLYTLQRFFLVASQYSLWSIP